MAVAVIMPRQGQSVESCIIGEWYVSKGDKVAVGYTTVGKINRTFEKEHRQIVLRKFLVTAIIVLVLLIGFIILNPFKSTSDIKRILGIDSKFNNEAYESFKDKEADQTINLPSQTHIKDHD